MTTTPVRLWGDEYRDRIDRHGENGNECVICGRSTGKRSLFVNADDGPEWYGDDMGWHPIGPECAKRARAAGWTIERLEV